MSALERHPGRTVGLAKGRRMTLEYVQPLIVFDATVFYRGYFARSSQSAGEDRRCGSPGPKRTEPQADANPLEGPRSSRCGRPLKTVYRPSIGGEEEGCDGMQPRRMQMRSPRWTGLLRRLLSERAPNGNGIPSPYVPLWPRALWLDWGPRDPHVESSFPNRFAFTGRNCSLPTAFCSEVAEKETLHRVCDLH
jgi:hypothetical protein